MDEPCSALDPRSTLQIEELMAELKRNYTIVIVTHNMQQAARASDKTVFLTMAEDRAGYVVEQGDDDRHLHEPEEPADRGLRVGSVRMSREETAMTDQPAERPAGRWTSSSTRSWAARRAPADRARPHPPREALDREQREIKDSVLRMGMLVEDQIRRGDGGARRPRRRCGAGGHRGRRPDQRGPAPRVDARSRGPSPRRTRSRATCASCSRSTTSPTSSSGSATTRRRSRSRSASSRRSRRSRSTSTCRRWASSRRSSSTASCGRWSTSTRSRLARSPRATTRSTDLYHKTFDEVVELMRAEPGQRRARDADPVRGALPRADRRPRRRTSPRTSSSSPAAKSRTSTRDRRRATRSGSCSCAPATRAGASWPRRCCASTAAADSRSTAPARDPEGPQPADAAAPGRGRDRCRRGRARSR